MEELAAITPLLLTSGAGAVAWWRVKEITLRTSAAALQLQQSYRLHSVNAVLYRHKIKQAVRLLRSNKIEPILIKGWANARLYTEAGLRPFGDVDLCVEPAQYAEAMRVLDSPEGLECWVDLHEGAWRLDHRSWDEWLEHSKLVRLDETDVRILGAEDHLRILCLHLLEHGAWRPIWLCDVGAVLESLPTSFDWNLCLGQDKRRAKWIASVIGLARDILGARVEHCPQAVRDAQLPNWLIPSVLKQWERPGVSEHAPPQLIMKSLRNPASVPKAILNRWPDPIAATIRLKGEFNEWPRLPFQICDYATKYLSFMTRLPRLLQSER